MKEPCFYVAAPIDGRGLMFPDNARGHCQICRCEVQYRPGGPERAEKHHGETITMVCLLCATHNIDTLEADRAPKLN
jgi:hypothetical protein